ncbi:MAG: hypothetical protein NZ926_01135 [Candidatus Methanomethylicia archaeon]|nr:hypothetical protein [Candidatus Methanomethylicia archaeon]MCX8169034.1 hypothetical protein [Candidatus Methanomethylicia archaeon]MDW7988766.1 hypothetical protein [Nitrososphaerota archaeon]
MRELRAALNNNGLLEEKCIRILGGIHFIDTLTPLDEGFKTSGSNDSKIIFARNDSLNSKLTSTSKNIYIKL